MAEKGKDELETVDYASELTAKIVKAIGDADTAAKPVQLSAAAVDQLGVAFNRRFHMKDGTVRFNPGVLNAEIVRPAGPIDPKLGIIAIHDPGAALPKAIMASFALHLDTTGGTQYSADYPFYIQQSLRAALSPDMTLLWGTGTCGDINHIDVSSKERKTAQQIGEALAETIKTSLPRTKRIDRPNLAMRSKTVRVPLQRYSADQLAWATSAMADVGTSKLPFLKQVEAYKILSLKLRGGDTIALEVQVLRLSDNVAIVGLPGEIFVELGLAIKRASPFATTLVVELCNDCPDYIPTKKGFEEGSYEIVNSRVAAGGGEAMVEAATELLKALKP